MLVNQLHYLIQISQQLLAHLRLLDLLQSFHRGSYDRGFAVFRRVAPNPFPTEACVSALLPRPVDQMAELGKSRAIKTVLD